MGDPQEVCPQMKVCTVDTSDGILAKTGQKYENMLRLAQVIVVFALLNPGALSARTHHYSSYSDKPEVFLKAIEQYRNSRHEMCKKDHGLVMAGIVTHHFLANQMMVEFFECLTYRTRPDRIVLIGPDHFSKGIYPITVSALPWKTPFGDLKADRNHIARIKKIVGLADDVEAFSGEHSIGILVPFIRYYFPRSAIVPIIIQNRISPAMLRGFKHVLDEFLDDPGTLVLLSMDFSHDRTSDEADRLDTITKRIITDFDVSRVERAEVDCRPGLSSLLAALKDRKEPAVKFLNHTNSAKITENRHQTDVTSYFTMLFSVK